MRMKVIFLMAALAGVLAARSGDIAVRPFGKDGKIKMLYDRRSRPQSVYIDKKIYIVYNGECVQNENNPKSAKAHPMLICYDVETDSFSTPRKLGPGDKDHHYAPVIWRDTDKRLHVLQRCHNNPGQHLIAKKDATALKFLSDWQELNAICSEISYPSVYNISGNRQVLYFRHEGHRGAWTYRITADNGKTWQGPDSHVVDLNMGGDKKKVPYEKMDEMSSYHTCFPSNDSKSLHVAFCRYDDNVGKIPEKFHNPRYKTRKDLGLKYNLYYVRIDLDTGDVRNFAGEKVKTPIDTAAANKKCRIWDTDWRGAGVPPDILVDDKDKPTFLHVLTEDDPKKLNYYYVRFKDGKWQQTAIAPSNHEWNSGHLRRDRDGVLRAYILVGEKYLTGGFNDKHGGGSVEEWLSHDDGKTWKKNRDLTPDPKTYPGWRFNNFRPVRRADAAPVPGLYLCYGWKEENESRARAFLFVDKENQ